MGHPGSSWMPAPAGIKWKYKCMLLNGLENFVNPNIIPLSERTDLPEEAKALLFTVTNLPTKGGLTSSRWYTPPSSPASPKKNYSTIASSRLNPMVKDFAPVKADHPVVSAASDSGSNHSTLNPAVEEFTPSKVSKYVALTESDASRSSSVLNPVVNAFVPVNMAFMADFNTVTISKGLAGSQWAEPITKTSTAAINELDPTSPIKAQDIPVHLRGFYIPPHLRTAGLRPHPGKTLDSFIEPHQRVGILPEVIPNDDDGQTPSSNTYRLINGGINATGSICYTPSNHQILSPLRAKSSENDSTCSPQPRVPRLASTFVEFMTGRREVPSGNRPATIPLATVTNVVREKIHHPSDSHSAKIVSGQGAMQFQVKAHKNGTSVQDALWPVQEALNASPAEDVTPNATRKVEKGEGSELMGPKVYSIAQFPLVDTRVQLTNQEYVKDLQEIRQFGVVNPQPDCMNLTRDALIRRTGGAPKDISSNGVDQFVSNDGLEIPIAFDDTDSPKNAVAHVRDSRGYLAELDESLQQRDGSWMPVPCSWEDERPAFHNAFIPKYITQWSKTITPVAGKVDVDREEFKSGQSPLSLLNFEKPLSQPLCYPDIQQSDNMAKQLVQTAEIDARTYTNRFLKRKRMIERQAKIAAKQQPYFEEEILVNPNIPKINVYLRPAQMKDVSGITSIYNHYVLNSIIPEDQSPQSEQQMQAFLKDTQEQGLPFIVAIKGAVPPGGITRSSEHVVGFASTEFYNYGISGSRAGASRFTGVIQLYVEPNHTRKGVGRSLMDRILVCSSTTHASKEGYNWVTSSGNDTTVYGQQGGVHKFHQLFIRRHIEVKADPDHEWLKHWLHGKFFIEEVARFMAAARSSSVGTTARMLDVLIFQFEATLVGGYDITC